MHSSVHTQIRSLYIDHQVLVEPPQTCRVVEVTPLLKELIRAFGELPIEYDENSAEGRLAAVLLDQLTHAPDMGLMLPLPADKRLTKNSRATAETSRRYRHLKPMGRALTCLRKNLKSFICAANWADLSLVAAAFTLAECLAFT